MLNVKPSWKNWQLLTEKGRHIWAFKPGSKAINEHLHNADNISDTEITSSLKILSLTNLTTPIPVIMFSEIQLLTRSFRNLQGKSRDQRTPKSKKSLMRLLKV